jgi:hypothetical protein
MSQIVKSVGSALKTLEAVVRKWFYQPDFQAILIVLGAMKSHYLRIGDPAWIFHVAPPGTGKTTSTIAGAANLPGVILLGDFSENTLLSGFYGHESPGVLEKLGPSTKEGNTLVTTGDGILMCKDFTTVLSMKREKRGAILSQLREIHDGEFKRTFGTGESKAWRGRITVIAAVTPALDRYYSIFSTLGERFLQVRSPRLPAEAAAVVIAQQGHEAKIKEELSTAVQVVFNQSLDTPPELKPVMVMRISNLAEMVAIGRTHVGRSSYTREVEYVPEPESPTRIAKGLAGLAKGIAAIKQHPVVTEDDFEDVFRVAMDCLPEVRRAIVKVAMAGGQEKDVKSTQTVKSREIENLRELGIIAPGEFRLSDDTANLLEQAGRDVVIPVHDIQSEPEDHDQEIVDVRLDGTPVYGLRTVTYSS